MLGVRYISPQDKWNKGKFKRWQDCWVAQHTAQGKRKKFAFKTQCSAILQRLQWEHERNQSPRGRAVLETSTTDMLYNILLKERQCDRMIEDLTRVRKPHDAS